MDRILSKPRRNDKPAAVLLLALVLVALTWAVYDNLPGWTPEGEGFSIGVDWIGAFRPASLALISGRSPYVGGMFNPPWALLPLAPLALLPPAVGSAAVFVLGLAAFGLAAARMKAPPLMVAAFVLTPQVLGNSANGNIDWLVALGATLPPQIGLFFVLTKPHIGAVVALFWLVEAWRVGRWSEVGRVFVPVTAAMLLSFALYGFWPLLAVKMVPENLYNTSLFPASLPIGAALLVIALRSRSKSSAIISTPFLSPYMMNHSWSIAPFGLLPRAEFWAAWVALWLARLVWGY